MERVVDRYIQKWGWIYIYMWKADGQQGGGVDSQTERGIDGDRQIDFVHQLHYSRLYSQAGGYILCEVIEDAIQTYSMTICCRVAKLMQVELLEE